MLYSSDDGNNIFIADDFTLNGKSTYLNAVVKSLKLQSQFRCNGSDAFLSWIDNTIQIRETANIKLAKYDFDFKVFDDPNELRKAIVEKNFMGQRYFFQIGVR